MKLDRQARARLWLDLINLGKEVEFFLIALGKLRGF